MAKRSMDNEASARTTKAAKGSMSSSERASAARSLRPKTTLAVQDRADGVANAPRGTTRGEQRLAKGRKSRG